jgi:hypothetical protein
MEEKAPLADVCSDFAEELGKLSAFMRVIHGTFRNLPLGVVAVTTEEVDSTPTGTKPQCRAAWDFERFEKIRKSVESRGGAVV